MILWLFSCCLIWAFKNKSWEVIIAPAVRLLVSYCLYETPCHFIVMSVHFEVDQSFSFLNFNLCDLSGLLAVKDFYSPLSTPPIRKAASFLLTLGSKSGFVCGFCSEALTQHEMTREQAVPPSNQFLLFQSNINRWLSWLWFWTRLSVGSHHQLLHKQRLALESTLSSQIANIGANNHQNVVLKV